MFHSQLNSLVGLLFFIQPIHERACHQVIFINYVYRIDAKKKTSLLFLMKKERREKLFIFHLSFKHTRNEEN
jgi:hypothetical protein